MSVASLIRAVDTGTVDQVGVGSPRRRGAFARLLRDRVALGAGVFLLLLVVLLLLAPLIAPADPAAVDTDIGLAGPSWAHPLGTDILGRDLVSRILYGGRVSVLMTLTASAGITIVGLTMGVATGLMGGRFDALVMRSVEIIQAVPMLIIAMVAIGLLGRGPDKLVLVFVAVGWPGYTRVIRGATLALRERRYVEASRALGATRFRVMLFHLVPNLAGPATVLSTLDLGRILLGLTALSFLGFGVQPPHPEWGRMIADARPYFYLAPRQLVIPGLVVSIFGLAVNLFGDGLRDALDVKVGKP